MLERTKPIWKPMVQNALKTRPKLDRALKLVMKFRKKNRPTGTMTRTPKTQMEHMSTPSEGNSTSYFTRRALRLNGFKKRLLRNSPLQLRQTEIADNINWSYGRQGVITFTQNSTGEMSQLHSLIPGNNSTTQLMLQSTKVHYMISSGSTAGIKLRIYEGCYKKDRNAPLTPNIIWNNGMIDMGSGQTINSIDSKPFSSLAFMKICHIAKVTNVFLPQGRTHEHYVDYRYNKIWNQSESNLSGGNTYLKGWTRFTMMVAYGEPIINNDNTTESTASGRIVIIGTRTDRFRYNNPTNRTISYVQAIPTTGITTERLIDEGDGAIETNAVL